MAVDLTGKSRKEIVEAGLRAGREAYSKGYENLPEWQREQMRTGYESLLAEQSLFPQTNPVTPPTNMAVNLTGGGRDMEWLAASREERAASWQARWGKPEEDPYIGSDPELVKLAYSSSRTTPDPLPQVMQDFSPVPPVNIEAVKEQLIPGGTPAPYQSPSLTQPPRGFEEDPSGSESDPFAAVMGGGSTGMRGMWKFQFPRDPSSKERPAIGEGAGVYTFASGMLGMSTPQVNLAMQYMGLTEDMPTSKLIEGLAQYSYQRGGGRHIPPWEGGVAPSTAHSSTVAQQTALAQGHPEQYVSGVKPGEIYSGQTAYPWSVALSIPGVTMTPEGEVATGAMSEGKLSKALHLGMQEYQVYYEGLGEPAYSKVTATGATVPEYGQRAMAWLAFGRTTPEGAGGRDPSVGAPYTFIPKQVTLPEGAEPLLEPGMRFARGQKMIPYAGAEPIEVPTHYAGWEVTHVGRFMRGPEDDQEERLALELRATIPEGAVTSGKGGGLKSGLVEQVGLAERWGAQFLYGDIREIAQLGASVAGWATAEEQKDIWGQEIRGEYTYEHAKGFKEYLLRPGVIHEEWSKTPALYQERSPITAAKEEAGILRRVDAPIARTDTPRPAGFLRSRMGMRAGADTPPSSIVQGRRRKTPEGTFWGEEASVGVRLPVGAQSFMAWDWNKQREGVETAGYLSEFHPKLVGYYRRRGEEAAQGAIGIGQAYFAQQGVGDFPSVDVTNLPQIERIRLEELAARRVQKESGVGPDDSSYGRLLPRAFMETLGEEYKGKLLRYTMEGEEDVYAPNPQAALAYTGAMQPESPMRGLPSSMYGLLRSQWESQEGTWRTTRMRNREEMPKEGDAPAAVQEQILNEQRGLMEAVRVGKDTTPGVQQITESGQYRRVGTGLHLAGGRFGGQVQPVEQLPQTRWVGGGTVLREHLLTEGMGGGQIDELVEQILAGERKGPAVLALRHPMLVKSQAQAVLGYMSPAEWVKEGYGTEEEYAKFETTAGFGRATAGVGGGDWDIDPYDIIMATAYNRTRAGNIQRQDLYGGRPLSSEQLWKLAEEHGAGELQSEIGKILDPSASRTESERVQYALEQVRASGQELTPERFRGVALQREVSRSQTGLIYNEFIRGMGQRITGPSAEAEIARKELGPLDLTAIDQLKRSEELTRLIRTGATLKKSSGGYSTLGLEGESGPGYVGSRTEAILAQQVSDIIAMPEKNISKTTRAAMIYDPGKDRGTFEAVLSALESKDPVMGVWDALAARQKAMGGGIEDLAGEMPVPGYTLQQAARRGMKEAGQLVVSPTGKSARVYQPGEDDIGLAIEGQNIDDLIAALGKKDVPLPQAIMSLLGSKQPEQRVAGERLLSQLGVTREQAAALAGTPEERIREQAKGPQPQEAGQRPPPKDPPRGAVALAAAEPPDPGDPGQQAQPRARKPGFYTIYGDKGEIIEEIPYEDKVFSAASARGPTAPTGAPPTVASQLVDTSKFPQREEKDPSGIGARTKAAAVLMGGEEQQWTIGNVPGRGLWSSIGPKYPDFEEGMTGRAQELMGKIEEFSQGAGAPLTGQRSFARPELARFKQVRGFMQELEQIMGSAEAGGAPGIQTGLMIERFQQGGAYQSVTGGERYVEQQAWEETGPNMRDPNVLGWLGQANIQGMQRMPGVGPARASSIAGLRTRFGNLQGVGGITDFGQLAQISGISEGMLPEMFHTAQTEGAIWASGGREAIGGLGEALAGAGMTTPEGVASNPMLRRYAGLYQQNIRAIGEGAPQAWQQQAAAMGAAEHQVSKEQAAAVIDTFKELKPDVVKRLNTQMDEASTGFEKLSTRLKDIEGRADQLGGLGQWDRRQVSRAGQMIGQQRRAIAGLEEWGGIGPEQALRARADLNVQEEQLLAIQRAEAEGPGGFWGGAAGQGIQGVAGRLMTGWGMMQINRMWGLTGAPAMAAIPVAAQQQQAFAGAALASMPLAEYQPSGMALDLRAYQAQQSDYQAAMGRSAYQAWGWTQQAGGEGLGTAAGLLRPAIGAGVIGTLLGTWGGMSLGAAATGIGLPVAAGLTIAGIGATTISTAQDREKMAVAAAGGQGGGLERFWQQMMAAPGALWQGIKSGEGVGNYVAGLRQYGYQIAGGDVAGMDAAGRTATIEYAARQATERGGPLFGYNQEQAAAAAGQFMNYGWGTSDTDISAIMGDPALRQMMSLGIEPQALAGQAAQFGLGPAQGQRMLDVMAGLPSGAARTAFQYSSQFYAPFSRFGMTPEMAKQLPNIENAQQGQFMQRLASGSQLAWSQFGMETGNQWAVTQNPQTGMGIGTNWGGDILAGRLGQVGSAGREIDVQGGQVTFNVTGQKVEFTEWGIQDYQREQQQGYQDWQYRFQMQGMGLTLGRQEQVWGFEDEGRDLSRARQWEQFGFQREGMAMSDRQFRERWNVNWQQLGVTDEWAQEDRARQWGRAQTQFGWQREDLAFRGATTSLQFGWQMEDVEENMRFATGRQRRQLQRQQERAAISYGMNMGQLDTQGERIDVREGWAREDFERAEEQHQQTMEWRRAEMQLQLRHHNEQLGLQQRQQGAAEAYFTSTSVLQDRQSTAARAYWTDTHNRQRQSIEMERRYALNVRESQKAQIALSQAQQIQMANFRMEWETGGAVQRSFSGFFSYVSIMLDRLSAQASQINLPRTGVR